MKIESNHGKLQSLSHLGYGLNPLIDWMKEQGINHLPFLQQAGIPIEALSQPEQTITPSQEIGFTRNVYLALRRPELGLLIGPNYHLSSYGMLGLAAMTAENLLCCFETFLEYIVLTWTYFKTSIYAVGDHAFIEMEPIRDLGDTLQYMIDRDLSAVYSIIKEALEQEVPLISAEFKHARTSYTDRYAEVFRCPIIFNASDNRIILDKHWLLEPLPKAEIETSRIFSAQCKSIATSLGAKYSFTEHVRYHLINSSHKSTTLDSIANILNMPTRTIQRRLASENTHFKELLDDVRISISSEYLLTTSLSIEEIAIRLNYNDAAAFSNAFKRWTGIAPTKYRKKWD